RPGWLRLFDVQDGTCLRTFDLPKGAPIDKYRFSPDGTLLAGYAWLGRTIYVWTIPDGELAYRFNSDGAGGLLTFGRRIFAFSGNDGRAVVVDTATGAEVGRLPIFRAKDGFFSDDGATLTVCNEAGVISHWDWKGGRRLPESAAPVDRIARLQFSAD